MRKILISLATVFLFISSTMPAHAACAEFKGGQELIESSDLIFLGKAKHTGEYFFGIPKYLGISRYNFYTKFEVTKLVKGDKRKYISIYYLNDPRGAPNVSPIEVSDQNNFIFAQNDKDGTLYFDACHPNTIKILDKIYSLKNFQTINAIIKQTPSIKTPELSKQINNFKTSMHISAIKKAVSKKQKLSPHKSIDHELEEYKKNPQAYICKNYQEFKLHLDNSLIDECLN